MEQKQSKKFNLIPILLIMVIIGVVIYAVTQKDTKKNVDKTMIDSETSSLQDSYLESGASEKEDDDKSSDSSVSINTSSKEDTSKEEKSNDTQSKSQTESKNVQSNSSSSASQEYNIPNEITSLLGRNINNVVGQQVQPDGYYNGSPYCRSADGKYDLIYSEDSYSYNNVIGVVGYIKDLIPSQESYTYSELKQKFGEKLSDLETDDVDGSYMCTAEFNNIEIWFSSSSSKFDNFVLIKK